MLGSAPPDNNMVTISLYPLYAANIKAVLPFYSIKQTLSMASLLIVDLQLIVHNSQAARS